VSEVLAIQAKLLEWRDNPCKFAYECFGFTPDSWQEEVLNCLPDPAKNRICIKANKGPGKTAIEAIVMWWFQTVMGEKGSHPKGAATSITGDNLKDNLWPELAKWRGRSQWCMKMFEWTKERIFARSHPETWFMSARTWPKSGDPTQQANTLAGLHADYLLFVLDESGGIPDAVMAAAEGGLSGGKWCKIMQAGNPTHLEGPLYRACTSERHLWTVIEITGDPDDPKRSNRISIQWAKEQIEKYGKDNPWVAVNVFGRFPPSSLNALLGPDEVNAAMHRYVKEEDFIYSQKRLGIDVSRFGDDMTVIFPRQGLVAFKPDEMRNMRSNDIAARVANAKAKWGSDLEMVDGSGGYGSGVIDYLVQAGHSPMEVSFSGKAIDQRYFNKRSEMWFMMAEWVKKGGSLPNIPEMVRELTTPTYTFQNGKFRLEEKDQIKERLGFSPDRADALALTFALPEMPKDMQLRKDSGFVQKTNYDYDPYSDRRA